MKREYNKIPKDPKVQLRIVEAVKLSGWPQYAIKDMMVRGILSRTLDSEQDAYMIRAALPRMLKDRTLLKAMLPYLGNKQQQHEFIIHCKEADPFNDFVRKVMERWYAEGKKLNTEDVMEYIRNHGGCYSGYARKCSDTQLAAKFEKIKNKIFCEAQRKEKKKEKATGIIKPKKIHFLRGHLVKITGPSEEERINNLKLDEVCGELDFIGEHEPGRKDKQKLFLQFLCLDVIKLIMANCPIPYTDTTRFRECIDKEYTPLEFNMIEAYALAKGAVSMESSIMLSELLNKHWFILKTIRKHNLDIQDVTGFDQEENE